MIEASLIDPGERLIWSGKPSPARFAMRKATHYFLFGIFFFGFSVFWIHGAYVAGSRATDRLGFQFWMFGIPFVVVGACMVLSPAWYFLRAMNTTYALTDRRAIMDSSSPFPSRTSVPLNQIPLVDVRSSAEGPGHVLFQEPPASRYYGGTLQRDGFIAIADAGRVGQMLRSAIDASAGARLGKL
jgi:hypothetical protein